jgi:HSPB1-associated protein 1
VLLLRNKTKSDERRAVFLAHPLTISQWSEGISCAVLIVLVLHYVAMEAGIMTSILESPIPLCMRNCAAHWNGLALIEQILRGQYKDVSTRWRVAPVSLKSEKEHVCEYLDAKFCEFNDWYMCAGGEVLPASNPFCSIPSRVSGIVSVYADYKYFEELFTDGSYPESIKWADLFNGDEDVFMTKDSTLWLSTKKAHTPMHYDSYGCNVVVQLAGEKKWKLWSPSSPSSRLHDDAGCRVPYEESTIYSRKDPTHPTHQAADFEFSLSAGDLLFVPKHFWHFVTTVSCYYFT